MPPTKKSNINSFIVGLLVFLVVIVILLMFYARAFDIFKSQENKNICATAVRTNAALKIKGSDLITTLFKSETESLSDIYCPVTYKKISGDEKYPGSKKDIDENIKQQIMQNMCDCYYTFGEGKLEIFEASTEKQKYCIVCHQMEFKGDAKGRKLSNFLDYMANNDCTVRGKKVNAMSYLSEFTTDPELFMEERQKNQALREGADTIDTSKEYATMFLYTKKGFLQKIWAAAAGASGGFLGGALAGVLLLLPEPAITKVAAIGISGSVAGGVIGYTAGDERSAAWDYMTWVFPFEEKALSILDCEYLPAIQQNQK